MSEKEFVLQTVAELNLNLFKLFTNEEVFREMSLTIWQLEEVRFTGQKIFLAIIGESHFICIEGLAMELLACTPLKEKNISGTELCKVVHGHDLNGFNFVLSENEYKYAVSVNFIPFDLANQFLPDHGKKIILLQEEFPFCHEGNNLSCWTKVRLAEDGDQLLLFTSHAYPPDYIVLTSSSFVFFARKRP